MQSILKLGIRAVVILGMSQSWLAIAENADPFRTQWRRAKPQAEFVLEKMEVKHLLPGTSAEVVAYLSQVTANKTRLQVLREELKNSAIEFVEVTAANPEGHNPGNHCLHTDPVSKSPLKVSKTDCGQLQNAQIWELLIKATVIHMNDADDELADYITLAINDSYQRRIESDPSFALFNRYKTAGTNPVFLYLDLDQRKLIRLSGAFSFNFTSLPPLSGSQGRFTTRGFYDRHSYETWMEGPGRFPDGKLGWGEIDNTRRYHSYPLKASIELHLVDNNTISISGSYETKTTSDQEPGTMKFFTYTMEYYPPTAEEIEAARLKANTEELKGILKPGTDPLSATEVARAEQLLRSGFQASEVSGFLNAALSRRIWNLVDVVLTYVPADQSLDREFFTLLLNEDRDAVRRALGSAPFRSRLSTNAMVDYQTAIGAVLKTAYKSVPHFWAHEKDSAQMLELLLGHGYDAKANITNISNVPRSAISSAVAKFRISPEIVKVILAKLDKEALMKPDERDRTALDYLVVHWNYVRTHCAAPAAQNAEAKAHYDRLLQRFTDVHAQLLAKGHDGKRRGCLYAQIIQNRPSCFWKSQEKEFGIYFESNYQPLPLEQRPGNHYGIYYPEQCL